jgi:hypothetical protein
MDGASLRASAADRERTVEALREHLLAGRLTLEEFCERIDAALTAGNRRSGAGAARSARGARHAIPPGPQSCPVHRGCVRPRGAPRAGQGGPMGAGHQRVRGPGPRPAGGQHGPAADGGDGAGGVRARRHLRARRRQRRRQRADHLWSPPGLGRDTERRDPPVIHVRVVGVAGLLGKKWGFERSIRKAPVFYALVALGSLGTALSLLHINPIKPPRESPSDQATPRPARRPLVTHSPPCTRR